jgi:uncharacterized protein YbaP (TraB family)
MLTLQMAHFRHPRVARALRCTASVCLAGLAASALAQPHADGRLWRVARAGIPDSYVFGTIHVADPRVAAIPPQVAKALARSRTLATELTVDVVGNARGFELEQLEDGGRLDALIGAADYARLREILLAQQVPEAAISRMKPWAAMLKATRDAAPERALTLDERLFALARARKMRLVPLEFIDEQVAAFDAIPLPAQVALLRHSLAHREAILGTTETTIAAWLRGDLAELARSCGGTCARFPEMREPYAELARHVVTDRTALLHHRLFMPLRDGRVFVAVGAMHLQGEHGLLALLVEDGYRVTRLW